MFNILVGSFTTESNAGVPYFTDLSGYDIRFNDECLKVMNLLENVDDDIRLIPSIYANANAAGVIDKDSFLTIENCILNSVKQNLQKIDGIYLHLHGASYVNQGIGSGDHHIVREIRKIVGPYLPIAVSCDPHGNLTEEYVSSLNLIRSYRESPHIDANDTRILVFKKLCNMVRTKQYSSSVYRKLDLILGGEQSVSADEPVKSINQFMNVLEKDERLSSVSWHVGYLRHDCPEAGCGIVVVPVSDEYLDYANDVANRLAQYVWDKRTEFHYTGLTASLDDSIKMAIENKENAFVITDSGDNTTSGATGWNTTVLREALTSKSNKSWLFASIKDEDLFEKLDSYNSSEALTVSIGKNHDNESKSIELTVVKKSKCPIYISHGEVNVGTLGEGILVSIVDRNIDIIVTNKTARITNESQIEVFGVNWKDYGILVLKQGYIFPDFKNGSSNYVMALTNGATPQNTKDIPFKLIKRPMFPIDEI